MTIQRIPFDVRLDRLTERAPNGCLIFTGCKGRKGYGLISFEGRLQPAHRAAYEFITGTRIPPGMQIDHLCRNPPCVEVTHLEVVTPLENRRRREDVQRSTCGRGHPYEGAKTSRGHRRCSECRRLSAKKKYRERRALGMSGREASLGRFLR